MPENTATSLGNETGAHQSTLHSSRMLAIWRAAVWLMFTVVIAPVQMLARAGGWRMAKTLPFYYCRLSCKIFGLKLVTKGHVVSHTPVLFVANHASYLDIPVLGAVLPARFVAKAEIEKWPFFGWLGKLQNTVFIDRKRTEAAGQKSKLVDLLNGGANLILFPEGTTGDGTHVLPFKSSLFSVADESVKDLKIQPVSVIYAKVDGLTAGRHLRPFISWYGDMTLAGHLWTMLGLGRIEVQIIIHAPLDATGVDRKQLALRSFHTIKGGVPAGEKERPEFDRLIPAIFQLNRPSHSFRP